MSLLVFELQCYVEAMQFVQRVLVDDFYCECAWWLLMAIRVVVGDDDGMLVAYCECCVALHELGAEPVCVTCALLDQLRC